MIKIKAEWVGRRWYQKTVPQAPAADCSAGGDERGGEEAAPMQARGATTQREDNLPYLRQVDVAYETDDIIGTDGRPPRGVIGCEEPFNWPEALIARDFEGEQNVENGMPRITSARGPKPSGLANNTSGEP